jgi:hypothetical protein
MEVLNSLKQLQGRVLTEKRTSEVGNEE